MEKPGPLHVQSRSKYLFGNTWETDGFSILKQMSSYIWNSARILRASVRMGIGLCNAPFMYITYCDANLWTNLLSIVSRIEYSGDIMEMTPVYANKKH